MFENALSRPNTSTRLSPRDPFFNLVDRFFSDDFMNGVFNRSTGDGESRGWLPAVDLIENDTAFLATVDLPGLSKDDVDISLEDNVLTLSGERTFKAENGDGTKFRRLERAYGSFRRAFTLPPGVDVTKVEASFDNGVLSVTLPKAETAKPRKINIS